MATLLTRHKVKNYTEWKRGYDQAGRLRKQHGIAYARVNRETSNPDDILAVHQS